MLERSDRDGQLVWMRIRRAIAEMQTEAVRKPHLSRAARTTLLSAVLVTGLACRATNASSDQARAAPLTIEFKDYPLTLKTMGPDVRVIASGVLTCYPDGNQGWDAKGEGTVSGTIYAGSRASFTASARQTATGRQVLMDFRAHDFMTNIAMRAVDKEASAPGLDRQAREECGKRLRSEIAR
jgi:hypothetical protein